jgi:hypothetical protein
LSSVSRPTRRLERELRKCWHERRFRTLEGIRKREPIDLGALIFEGHGIERITEEHVAKVVVSVAPRSRMNVDVEQTRWVEVTNVKTGLFQRFSQRCFLWRFAFVNVTTRLYPDSQYSVSM